MSIEQAEKEIEAEIAALVKSSEELTQAANQSGILDMKKTLDQTLEDLKELRTLRALMVAKRAELDKATKIIERRIKIALDNVATISLPY